MTGPVVRRGLIDPNVRVNGSETFNGFEDWDQPAGPPGPMEHVVLYELEDAVEWDAMVVELDHDKRLVYLNPHWSTERPIAGTDPVPDEAAFAAYRESLAAERSRRGEVP